MIRKQIYIFMQFKLRIKRSEKLAVPATAVSCVCVNERRQNKEGSLLWVVQKHRMTDNEIQLKDRWDVFMLLTSVINNGEH